MRNQFGWSYPPGAEHDPNAPYNQVEGCPHCGYQSCDCEEALDDELTDDWLEDQAFHLDEPNGLGRGR